MTVRYCSDSHLHDVVSLDWRNNMDVNDYAQMLIHNWNESTASDDTVYFVGDIGRLCPLSVDVLHQLKGNKILVIGNHDAEWLEYPETHKIFVECFTAVRQDNVLILHDPADVPAYDLDGVDFIIHGHHHQYDSNNMRAELLAYARDVHRYNCCLDLNKNKPCTIQELMTNKAVLLDRMALT